MVQEIPPLTTEIESYSVKTLGDDEISVSVEDDIYIVHCPRLERIIAGTDLDIQVAYDMFIVCSENTTLIVFCHSTESKKMML